ncbi:MAG: hypothetical protein NC339_03530 [Muribaculaceae bacterium]|nr:hypothetical protein [Muribaculaceae bacterium]
MRKLIISLLAALPVAAAAQTLHQDIDVDQQTAPVKREAARITILPEVKLPAINRPALSYSSKVVSTRVPGVISTLEPAAWVDPEAATDTRGYITGGIFPLFNADISAGFRILDTDRTRLSLWGQYDGRIYHRGHYANLVADPPNAGKALWRDHTATVGLDLHQTIGSRAILDAGLDYTYGHNNIWSDFGEGRGMYSRTSSRVNFNASYSSSAEGLNYSARVRFNRFAFTHAGGDHVYSDLTFNDMNLVAQNLFGVGASGSLALGETSMVALDADLNMLHTGDHIGLSIPYKYDFMHSVDAATSGIFSVRPRFINRTSTTSVTIGAVMDVAIKSGKALNFAPDVTLAWMPSQIFGIELSGKGGTVLNSVCSLYEGVSPYLNTSLAYGSSRLLYDLGGNLSFGPFLNFTVEAFAHYARTDGWLMPVFTHGVFNGGTAFERLDLKGHHLGVNLRYDNGRNIAVKAGWSTAPSSQFRGWYEWRDRARQVVDAELTVRPLKPLAISAGFELRSGRAFYEYKSAPSTGDATVQYYDTRRISLGTVANLRLAASWRYTKKLTFFVSGENLLSRRWNLIGSRPTQGATGLVGASYKF